MDSSKNPITVTEDAILESILDCEIDDKTVFNGEPADKVQVVVGDDDYVFGQMQARASKMPMVWLRFSGWWGLEEKPIGNIVGLGEQSGNMHFDLFIGCAAPRSRIEAATGALGLVGFKDLLAAVMEQIAPLQLGLASTRNEALNQLDFLYLYFGAIERMASADNMTVIKVRLMAVPPRGA